MRFMIQQLMEITLTGAIGRLAHIHVALDTWLEVEHAPTPLRQTVDLNAQDWGNPCRVHSVSLWIVQVSWNFLTSSNPHPSIWLMA